MEISPDQVPDTDVIVGSPPCVTFSSSNKAGKADKSTGIELIEKFLQIVAIKKHKRSSLATDNFGNFMRYFTITNNYTFIIWFEDFLIFLFKQKTHPPFS